MATPTGTLKSISLAPGECIVLPVGAVIDSIIAIGDAAATSSCGILPTPSNYKCGFFAVFSDDDGGAHPNDEGNTPIVWVKFGNTTIYINEQLSNLGPTFINPDPEDAADVLNLHIPNPDQAIFKFTAITTNSAPADRKLYWIYFRIIETLYDVLELKMSTFNNDFYLKPIETVCGDYPNPL